MPNLPSPLEGEGPGVRGKRRRCNRHAFLPSEVHAGGGVTSNSQRRPSSSPVGSASSTRRCTPLSAISAALRARAQGTAHDAGITIAVSAAP